MEHHLVSTEPSSAQHDLSNEFKEFQETKAGVKGLVDSGISKIPRMFIHEEKMLSKYRTNYYLQIPLIDLKGLEYGERMKIVDEIRGASETWGFFQLINYGIPISTLDKLLECQKQFHEQPTEVKQELYSLDSKQRVRFFSNSKLHVSQQANWRDTLAISFPDDVLDTDVLPIICREVIISYMKCMFKLKDTLCELLSEALGLSKDYRSKIGCMKGGNLLCHYYPTCPEPHLTQAAGQHSDPAFLTILLQDEIGGLQVLHENQWVGVPPTRGSLVVNIGDLMQLISNDKFKSVKHRVVAKSNGPRLSAACFFNQYSTNASKHYGPLKELLSYTNPPIYREILPSEYLSVYRSEWMGGNSVLPHFKL